MSDRTHFLMFGRRFHNTFRSAIENGDGRANEILIEERPIFEHYACGMYLSGCLSYLENTYGHNSWKSTDNGTFDTFIANHQKNNFSNFGICEDGIDALICIRNAFIHNNGDLSLNRDINSLSKVISANIIGVKLAGDIVTLFSNRDEDFMEYVRLSLVAVAQFNGDG